jgi:hypothetical protein
MQYTIWFSLEIMTKDAKVHLGIKVVLQLHHGGYSSKVTSNLINRFCAGFQFIKILLLQVSTLYTAINKAMAMFIYFSCNTKPKHKFIMASATPNFANYHTDPATSAVEDFITDYTTKVFLTYEWVSNTIHACQHFQHYFRIKL